MKLLIAFAVTILGVAGSFDGLEKWSDFKLKYEKSYISTVEEKLRYEIFKENLRTIEEHNVKYENGEVGYFMGVNKFADQTPEEYRSKLRMQESRKPEMNKTTRTFSKNDEFPKALDWREKGAVLKVKDQQSCAASWVFSATGALEGQNAIINNISISLSDQQMIDCGRPIPDLNCIYGSAFNIFNYLGEHGIVSEEDYPYTGNEETECHVNESKAVIKHVYGSESLQTLNETALLYGVAEIGPIVVDMNFNPLQFYQGGIFDDKICLDYQDTPNQEVLVVGYNITSETPYWIIKQAWGTDWGEDGYLRLEQGYNMCGIAMYSIYPILEAKY